MLRDWLARHLPRWLAVALAIRVLTPLRDPPTIANRYHVRPPDTGGGFRPDFREQDPGVDPKEPYGGESSSKAQDHGWNNCTMSSGALAYAYQVHDQTGPWGGHMRHAPGQSDLSGGTDLYDLRDAWAGYGDQDLKIRSGQGWAQLKEDHAAGRAIIVQGTGNTPGSGTYGGGHACIIGPETQSDGDWLWGDPLADGWQFVPPSKIKSWMEALCGSGLCYAVSKKPDPPPEPPEPTPGPEPEPEPPPAPPMPGPGYWRPPGASYVVTAWGSQGWGFEAVWSGGGTWPLAWPDVIPRWDHGPWGPPWHGSP